MPKDAVQGFKDDRITIWIISVSASAYICVYLFLSFYAHPSADDFTFANKLANEGFIRSQLSWYFTWSGRYASTALISSFLALFNVLQSFWLLPLFLIVTTCISFVVLPLCIRKENQPRLRFLCCGLVLTVLYFSTLPSTSETIYWLAGGITYQLGNSLYLLLLAALIKLIRCDEGKCKKLYLGAGLLVLVIAGMNETIMLLQSITLLVVASFSWARKSPQRYKFLTLTAISMIGAAIVVAAPGNAVRSSYFPLAHNITFSLTESMRWACIKILTWSNSPTLWLATILWVAATASIAPRTESYLRLIAPVSVGVLWLLVTAAMFFPAFWSMGSPPPDRTLSISYMLFLFGWFFTVTLSAFLLPFNKAGLPRSCFRFIAVIFAICLFTTSNGARAVHDLSIAPGYSKQLNERYQSIRLNRGQTADIKVPVLSQYPRTIHVTDITPEKDDWINKGYATFFHLQSIATTSKKF